MIIDITINIFTTLFSIAILVYLFRRVHLQAYGKGYKEGSTENLISGIKEACDRAVAETYSDKRTTSNPITHADLDDAHGVGFRDGYKKAIERYGIQTEDTP